MLNAQTHWDFEEKYSNNKTGLKHTCIFSHTFFFGLSLSSGLPVSYPSTKTCSPGDDPSGGSRGSTLLGSPSLEINQPERVEEFLKSEADGSAVRACIKRG